MLTTEEARGLALRAQGFGRDYGKPVDVLRFLGAVQLDSVNVVARSHELVVYSRFGSHDTAELYDQIYGDRAGFEFWGHSASWLPYEDYQLFLHRAENLRAEGRGASTVNIGVRAEHSDLYQVVLDRIRDEGPLGAADFAGDRRGEAGWWNFKPVKRVLEDLFDQGVLMCAGRTAGFARLYDLASRVLPVGTPTDDPGPEEAVRQLVARSVRALGVATGREVADYYRLHRWKMRWQQALDELVADGVVAEVRVEGWKGTAYAIPEVLDGPRTVPDHAPVFLSPLDNLVWHRPRVLRIFGFEHRFEIYIPAERRQYGYYVLPLLADGRLEGRADLKHDRQNGVLRVVGLWLDGADPAHAAAALRSLADQVAAPGIAVEAAYPASAATHVKRILDEG